MSEVIFDADGLVIFKQGSKYYARYDAEAHQIAMREDDISDTEVKRLMSNPTEATKVLFELQERLMRAGIDPYVSNIGP